MTFVVAFHFICPLIVSNKQKRFSWILNPFQCCPSPSSTYMLALERAPFLRIISVLAFFSATRKTHVHCIHPFICSVRSRIETQSSRSDNKAFAVEPKNDWFATVPQSSVPLPSKNPPKQKKLLKRENRSRKQKKKRRKNELVECVSCRHS